MKHSAHFPVAFVFAIALAVTAADEAPSTVVTTTRTARDPSDGVTSIYEALDCVRSGAQGNTITFRLEDEPRIVLDSTLCPTTDLVIDGRNLGSSGGTVVLDGGNTFDANGVSLDTGCCILDLCGNIRLVLQNLVLQNGYGDCTAGALCAYVGQSIGLTNVVFRENVCYNGPGAIQTDVPTYGRNLLFERNSGCFASGAICSFSLLALDNVSFLTNTTARSESPVLPSKKGMTSAAIIVARATGGAILSANGLLSIQNATFAGNTSFVGGAIAAYSPTAILNATFFENTAYLSEEGDGREGDYEYGSEGGAIFSGSSLLLMGTTFVANKADMDGCLTLYGSNVNIADSILFSESPPLLFSWSWQPTWANFSFCLLSPMALPNEHEHIAFGTPADVFQVDSAGKPIPTRVVREGIPHLVFRPIASTHGARMALGDGSSPSLSETPLGFTWASPAWSYFSAADLEKDQLGASRTAWTELPEPNRQGFEFYVGAASPAPADQPSDMDITAFRVKPGAVEMDFRTDLSGAAFLSWLQYDSFRLKALYGNSPASLDERRIPSSVKAKDDGTGTMRLDVGDERCGFFKLCVE